MNANQETKSIKRKVIGLLIYSVTVIGGFSAIILLCTI